jgi:hypothetical protein
VHSVKYSESFCDVIEYNPEIFNKFILKGIVKWLKLNILNAEINGALIFLTNVNLVLGLFYVLVVGQRQGKITAKLASTKKVATLQRKRKINE